MDARYASSSQKSGEGRKEEEEGEGYYFFTRSDGDGGGRGVGAGGAGCVWIGSKSKERPPTAGWGLFLFFCTGFFLLKRSEWKLTVSPTPPMLPPNPWEFREEIF